MNPTDPTSVVPAVSGTDPSAAPVQSTERTAIYDKYQQTYFGETPPADPAAPVDPVVPVTETPAVAAQPDVNIALQALLAEVTSLRADVAKAKTPEPTAPVSQADWLELLSQGKKSDGEAALAKALGPGIEQRAVQQALAIMQSERAINDFVTEIRTSNPELAPMEAYIALAADATIKQAQAAGKVNSPADYVKVYKEAVTAEIEKARTLSRTFQGIGKTQATTRIEQVAAVPTLKSNAVNVQREAPAAGEPAPAETASDYLAARQANHARISGMGS